MSDLNNAQSAQPRSGTDEPRTTPGDAVSNISHTAQQAAREMKKAAASLGAEATRRAKSALQQKIGEGADFIGNLATSTKLAADHLDPDAPQVAGLVRDVADRMDAFSREIQEKPIDEWMAMGSDFARRRPVALFGAAAICGFVLFRMIKAPSAAARRDVAPQPAPAPAGMVGPHAAEPPSSAL